METTVLIIDDDMAIRESLAAYLEDRDYRVVLANDGKSGLKALEAERPDLALVDLSMPGVDGFGVLKRAGETMPDTPVIVVSGTGRISDTVRALHLGAWDYILKPIEDMSVVEHAMQKALDRARLRRDNLRYQNQLEELVQARTMELEHSNSQLRNLNARLRRLVETTSGLSSCFEIKEFGRRLLEEFARNMAASGGSIYSVEKDGLCLLHTLDPGHAPEIIPFPLPEDSILSRLLNQTEPLLIDDIQEHRDLTPSGWTGYRSGSMLAFPLVDETGKVSILLALHNKYAPPFVEQDKEIGIILASYSRETLRAIRNFNALRESEKRFRDLTNLLPQIVCEVDTEGKFTYVNQNTSRMLGYAEGELEKGYTVLDVVAPEDHPIVRESMERILSGSGKWGNEYTARRKDGTRFPVVVYASPIILDGVGVGMRAIVIDITERKAGEAERERLIRAIEHVNESVVITDVRGTIEYVNSAFSRCTGYSPEEAIGQNLRILKSGKHDDAFYRELWETITSGKTWEGHIINKKKNGDLYTDETTVSPVWDSKGNIVQYVSIKRDITHELEMESQMRRSQKMEAIGTLASGIAHDFNNILSAILGYSEMALRGAEENERLSSDIQQVLKAGNRAKDLVAQILTFSRRTEGERKPMRLQPIVKEAMKLIRASLPSTIDLATEFDPNCGPILADATQIHQVLMNLCTNAYHAMREKGGTLTVRLRQQDVPVGMSGDLSVPPAASYVVITVSDTGHGMSQEILERIFEPYFTTKEPGEGTGLGMAIVHGIVQSHSGIIRVSSELGIGTTIDVSFPLCIEAEGDAIPDLAERPIGTERVLFVDDEEAIATVIKYGLERMGFRVTSFSKPMKAMDYFHQHPDLFDVVVTDLTMPKMTGIELARQIHLVRTDIPIILCSGYGKAAYENQGRQVGIREFVEKPIHPSKLGWAIRRRLDKTKKDVRTV